MSQIGYGNNVWRDFGTIDARLQPLTYWDTIGESQSSYLRSETLNWVSPGLGKHNNGTLQGTTIQAGGPDMLANLPQISQSFGYDSLNRLTAASEGSAWSQSYSYDQFGNMWMPPSANALITTGPSAPTANVYSSQNQPGNNQNTNLTYDAGGNLSQFGGGGLSLKYDAENRQITAGSNGITACTTCYLSFDYLGSVRMVTDTISPPRVIARHDYAPFGQEIPAGVAGRTSVWGGSDNVNQRFTGQERDEETNLDFFQARYMSNGMGRFMSPDPANAGADFTNPQSWNAYAYVLGNPLNSIDLTGMASNYSGIQDGTCPASKAACPVSRPPVVGSPTVPNEINVGEDWYVQNVAIPGYLTGIPDRYPGLIQFFQVPGSTSTTIYYGLALLANLSARTAVDVVGGSPDWGSFGQAVATRVGIMAPAMQKSVGVFAGASVATASLAAAPEILAAGNEAALGPAAGRALYNQAAIGAARAAAAGYRTLGGAGSGLGVGFAAVSRSLPPGLASLGWRILSAAWVSGAAGTVPVFAEDFSGNGYLSYSALNCKSC